jgi:hypothetical protein
MANDIQNDPDAIRVSNYEAINRTRIRSATRTPDASKNNNSKYPMRTVQEYIGGHRQVYDSTPGSRVVEFAHGSGTFQQWSEDGTEIRVVVGNKHEHLKEGYTLTVGQNGDIRIEGHARVSVGGGCHIEVAGDASIVSTGTITHYASKDYNIVAGGSVNIMGQRGLNLSTDGAHKVKVNGDHTAKIGGKSDVNSGGNMTIQAPKIDLNP